jgi:hypothetical protein
MKLTGNFQVPKVNLNQFQQALHQELTKALVEGAKVYLEKVVPENKDEHVPVWSGASRATFARLASYVEYAIAWGPVTTPAGQAPDRVAMGLEHGEAVFDPGRSTSGVYTFTYETTLPHLIINESYDATQWGFRLRHPGPYHFQEKGRLAFEQFASTVVLPGWGSLLGVAQLRVG